MTTNLKQVILAQFDKCPNKECQSKKTLMKELVAEEAKAGRLLDKNTIPCLQILTAAAISPMNPPLIGSLIATGTALLDVCLDCGTVYAPLIVKSKVPYRDPVMPGMPAFDTPHLPPGKYGNPRVG